MALVVIGDDVEIFVRLYKSKATFNIPNSATVKAALVSLDKTTQLITDTTIADTDTGADWPNSLVAVNFTAVQSATVTALGRAVLEIQVDDTKKQTWFVDVDVTNGTIS